MAKRRLCMAIVLFIQTGARSSCRDRLLQPFAATSIWNTAIGSNAQYAHAGIFTDGKPPPAQFHNDQEWIIDTQAGDAAVPWHSGYFGSCKIEGPVTGTMRLPHNFTTDCGPNNNPAAILQPNRTSFLQVQPIFRGKAGGPVMAQHLGTIWGGGPNSDTCMHGDCNVFSNGTSGAHGGSGLSAVGGAIRAGELLASTPPIAHALKLELYGHSYYYWDVNTTTNRTCWRWPASACDGYAAKAYRGTNPQLMPGSLLAVAPAAAATLLPKMRSVPAAKILAALRDYGGYLVDDTAGPAPAGSAAFCAEHAVNSEVLAAYGWDIRCSESNGTYLSGVSAKSNASVFYWDLVAIFQSLSVVVNNQPGSVGGGGAPRRPPPPPICD